MWRKTNLYNSAKQQISAEYTLTETIRSKIYKKFEHIVTGDTCFGNNKLRKLLCKGPK